MIIARIAAVIRQGKGVQGEHLKMFAEKYG